MKTFSLIALIGLAGSLDLRAAETYQADPAHTTVGFSVAHLVITDVAGRFNEFEGTVVAESNRLVAIKGTIQVNSVDTGIARRDEHLRSADFFDVAKFPTITFESVKIEVKGNEQILTGKFTIRDVTKEITAPVTVKGPITDMAGKQRLGLRTQFVINRKDYGLTWSRALETGALVVGDEVTITINASVVQADAAKP